MVADSSSINTGTLASFLEYESRESGICCSVKDLRGVRNDVCRRKLCDGQPGRVEICLARDITNVMAASIMQHHICDLVEVVKAKVYTNLLNTTTSVICGLDKRIVGLCMHVLAWETFNI